MAMANGYEVKSLEEVGDSSSHLVGGASGEMIEGKHPSGQEFVEDDEVVMKPDDEFVDPAHRLDVRASRGWKMQRPGTSGRTDESTGGLPDQALPDRRRGRHVASRRG